MNPVKISAKPTSPGPACSLVRSSWWSRLIVVVPLVLTGTMSIQASEGWDFDANLAFKAGYDSNVYLQDTTPSSTVANALPADQTSLVAHLTLNTLSKWSLSDNFKLSFAYNPEMVSFVSASDESHVTHITSLNISGGSGATVWALKNMGKWIDGSDVGPTYGGPGGAASMGGLPVRDRRDAFVDVGSLQLTHTWGDWFVRPAITVYLHDFGIQQRSTAGYVNFIDRSEFMGGIAVGYKVLPKAHLTAGIYLGNQQQYKLHGVDSPYDSTIRRFLVGIEGQPLPWLKLDLRGGPESRSYAPGTPVGFNRGQNPLWISGSATVTVSPKNQITLFYTHRDLPSSASRSMYVDTVGKLFWKSQVSDRSSVIAGYTLIRGDWRLPAVRNDRIHAFSLAWKQKLKPGCDLELGWVFDRAVSPIPNTSGREYTRHQLTVGLQFTF